MTVGRKRKLKSKVLCMGMIIVLLLSACQNEDSFSQLEGTKESYIGMGGVSITSQVGVYIDDNRLLHLYDSKHKEDVILCNKANCAHEPYNEDSNPDPTCDAALNEELCTNCVPIISGKYIYLFGEENLSQGVAYRINLDGTERTKMYTMDYQVKMGSSAFVENNLAYVEACVPVVSEDELGGAGTNQSYDVLLKINLETGKIKEISPIDKKDFQGIKMLDKKGDKLFFNYFYRVLGEKDKDYSTATEYNRIYCYDIEEDKTTLLFDEAQLSGLSPVGVTEYALCLYDIEKSEAYEISLKDKKKTLIYKPIKSDVMYFVYKNKWIIGDIESEKFSYLQDGKEILLPEINSFLGLMGNYVEYTLKDGRFQISKGDSLFTDERDILFERGE